MNKLGDDLYQRLHGFKSVKRSHKKQGQSDWYYLNPRYDTDGDPRGEIDVPSENSFNPKLSSILADDMNENPEDYYIWRTEKDDRVRGKHAEREGKIFNWHIPPEGGHPGEDYNCRCWAEPYRPEKTADKPIIVDVIGLDMFKELQKTLKPVDFDTSNLPQYAENDKVTTATDAVYAPSDEFLYAKMWENIKRFERIIPYPYIDTKGLITIGGGVNVNNWSIFKNLNLTIDGVSATEAQKWEAYKHMRELSEEKDEDGNYVNRNRLAETFEPETMIRISDIEARSLAQNHMNNDLAHLREEFTSFDYFPLPLKEILLDIQYNVKGGISENKWPKLYKAIREKNVFGKDGIVENVNRPDVGKERNDWAKKMAHLIRF